MTWPPPRPAFLWPGWLIRKKKRLPMKLRHFWLFLAFSSILLWPKCFLFSNFGSKKFQNHPLLRAPSPGGRFYKQILRINNQIKLAFLREGCVAEWSIWSSASSKWFQCKIAFCKSPMFYQMGPKLSWLSIILSLTNSLKILGFAIFYASDFFSFLLKMVSRHVWTCEHYFYSKYPFT